MKRAIQSYSGFYPAVTLLQVYLCMHICVQRPTWVMATELPASQDFLGLISTLAIVGITCVSAVFKEEGFWLELSHFCFLKSQSKLSSNLQGSCPDVFFQVHEKKVFVQEEPSFPTEVKSHLEPCVISILLHSSVLISEGQSAFCKILFILW